MRETKVKEGIFVGPQLKQLKTLVQNQMLQTEEHNWHLKSSAETFWTVKKEKNSSEIVQEVNSSYSAGLV